MGNRLLIISLCSVLLLSCNPKRSFDNEKDLLNYINEESNGYAQSKTINGIDFNLIYRPTDALVNQELDENITTEHIQLSREKYSKYLYFNLSLNKNNQELLSVIPKNKSEFGDMVKQLTFGMQDKVHLFTQKKDTLDMVDFVYPRMYGMSKVTTIMFVFQKDEKLSNNEILNFTVKDLGFFTGEVKFKIQTKKLINEPRLSFLN